jgi:hypothetical protein
VVDRRDPMMQAASPAYKAMQASIDKASDRTEAIFDRVEKRLDRIERDQVRADQGQDRLAGELVELRRDVGELRDATHLAANKAATAAVVASGEVIAAVGKRPLWMKWQAWAVAFVAFVAFYKNVGQLARDVDRTWDFIVGRPPHVVAEKKDPTDGK